MAIRTPPSGSVFVEDDGVLVIKTGVIDFGIGLDVTDNGDATVTVDASAEFAHNHSYYHVTTPRSVVAGDQMLVQNTQTIDAAGCITLNGQIVYNKPPTGAVATVTDNFSHKKIPANTIVEIPENQQMVLGGTQVNNGGRMKVDGQVYHFMHKQERGQRQNVYADYTIPPKVGWVTVFATSAAVTVTLPPESELSDKDRFGLKKDVSSTETVTIDGNGLLIDGVSSWVLSSSARMELVYNASNKQFEI